MSELRKVHRADVSGNFARLRKEEFGLFFVTTDNTAQFYVVRIF